MHTTAIVVITKPDNVEACSSLLADLPGVDVQHRHPTTGRIVVQLRAMNDEGHRFGLYRIKAMPGVILAESTYRFVDSAAEKPSDWLAPTKRRAKGRTAGVVL